MKFMTKFQKILYTKLFVIYKLDLKKKQKKTLKHQTLK